MSEEIDIQRRQHVLEIRFNRPDKKNALTPAMYHAVADEIEKAEDDLSVHVIVISSQGKDFTAGNDLKQFDAPSEQGGPAPPQRLRDSIVRSTVPMIAGVRGVAAGFGATMLLHMDSVIATEDARLLYPFANLGLTPECGSTYLMPKILGYTRAADLLMRARPVSGREAEQLGIVSMAVADSELDGQLIAIADEIAAKPPQAMRKTKQLLKGDGQQLREQLAQEDKLLAECFASDEHRQLMAAMMK